TPAAPWLQVVAGKPVGQQFRSLRPRLRVTISLIGLGPARALFLARPTQLQSRWAGQSPKQRLSLITDHGTDAAKQGATDFRLLVLNSTKLMGNQLSHQ